MYGAADVRSSRRNDLLQAKLVCVINSLTIHTGMAAAAVPVLPLINGCGPSGQLPELSGL